VRSNYGACSTILFEYLREASLEIDMPLATALMYAIRSDTQDLGSEACKSDIAAIQALYPLANLKMLSDIQRGRVERGYFKMLSIALNNATACEKCIISNLGEIDNADMIAEVADMLLRDDKAVWTLCYGFHNDKMLLSIRNSEAGKKAGEVMRKIVSRIGTGGGHDKMAGGQISLEKKDAKNREKIEETVRKRFHKHIGVNPSKCSPLLE
jgi:nanoRNase/pAp phosphatase (c-di-AMP/oligoRNAs hydrolase)